MQSYVIPLKNEKATTITFIEAIVVCIHLIVFAALGFFNLRIHKGFGLMFSGAIVAFIFLLFYFIGKEKKYRNTLFDTCLFYFSVCWFNAEIYWMAFLIFIFSTAGIVARQKASIIFNTENIIYKIFPPKRFLWINMNNVILKDGLLTLDFKNNRLIQAEITEGGNAVDETEFNDFCSQQLQTTSNSEIPVP